MTGQNGFCGKELRIALVCYGGVSLAVYMHGVTKEIFKLVRAARAFDAAFDADPALESVADPFTEPAGPAAGGPEYDTERAYFAALVAMARSGTPVTALVDLVAGTSAGGINGVCLARAIAHDRSLNGFRSLWIDMGDLEVLLEGHGLGFTHEQRMVSKLAVACAELVRHPGETSVPLKGALMSLLLYSALRATSSRAVPTTSAMTGSRPCRLPPGPPPASPGRLTALFAAYRAQLRHLSVGSSRGFWDSFHAVTVNWEPRTRRELACRYLAFPIWDALIFPIIALARLPQLTPIGVTRFSPLDASRLTPVDENGTALPHKLRGTALAHFGGFFDKEWRENDYLWGRLDGAELVLRLLSRAAGGADLAAQLDDALTVILTTERQPLGLMRAVMTRLAAQVRAGS